MKSIIEQIKEKIEEQSHQYNDATLSFRHHFEQGCLFMLPLLEKAISQRTHYIACWIDCDERDESREARKRSIAYIVDDNNKELMDLLSPQPKERHENGNGEY